MQLLSPTTKPAASAESCARELLDALPPVMRFVRHHMRSQRAKGLSIPQFRALVALGSTPGMSLSAVAEFLGASLPTASRIVSGLVNKGLVMRGQSKRDRRQVDLQLTARGAHVREVARHATLAELSGELQRLTQQQRAAMDLAMRTLQTIFSPGPRLATQREDTSREKQRA
jgi:DNA-binding MarR family transcriptional regulator